MDIAIGELLTIEEKKYITLEVLTHKGNNYAFVNKVTDEDECTDEFYIFEILEDGIRIVIEDKLKNELMTKFQNLLEKDIKELL